MADRIDTDAIRNTAIAGDPNAAAVQALCDEVDRLRALADPAPVGLTEKELRMVSDARELAPPNPDYPIPWDRYLLARLVTIIDRLSAAPVDDRVPAGWRVEWRTEEPHGPGEGPREIPYLVRIPMAVSPSVDPEEG